MNDENLISISDFNKLAILDLHKIIPKSAEHNGRYWAYFSKDEVEKILADYDAGRLKVIARDFVSAISRTKDRIFELERARTRANGAMYGNRQR
jgi:hypothetical protein